MSGNIKYFPHLRIVNNLPPFPDNPYGLKRGSYIHSNNAELAEEFGFPVGQPIPLCYDGKLVRCHIIGWKIEDLVDGIKDGTWIVSDMEPVPTDLIATMEINQGGGQVTAAHFWTSLWDTQRVIPEKFKLQTAPDVSADDLKKAALTAGKNLFIEAEMAPGQVHQDESGLSMSMILGSGDVGILSGHFWISMEEMLSGNRYFLCKLI